MLETCRGPWFPINWMKIASRWFHYTDSHNFFWAAGLLGPKSPLCWGFEIAHRNTTLGKTPLGEGSACRRDLYLTTDKQKRQTSISPAVFEPTISASSLPQNYALDRVATADQLQCNQHKPVTCMSRDSSVGYGPNCEGIDRRLLAGSKDFSFIQIVLTQCAAYTSFCKFVLMLCEVNAD
jgi:hypothetical protein